MTRSRPRCARRSASCARAFRSILASAGLLAGILTPLEAGAAGRLVLDGIANVLEDGSLRLQGRTVRLFGLLIPLDERTCSTVIRPARCGAPSALVLEQKVQGFVRCEIVRALNDGSLEGICTTQGRDLFGPRLDLGASLVAEGWALVSPGAPASYQALERLAQSRERGLWGDDIVNFR